MGRFLTTVTILLASSFIAGTHASVLKVRNSLFDEESCVGRCNQTGTIPDAPCQCNSACIRYNDCCSDYHSLCLGQSDSCVGRCHQSGTIPGTCQCNKPCVDYGDCCPDYSEVCLPTDDVSDEELEDLSEQLLRLEEANNANQFIQVSLQERTTSESNNDMAPNELLTVRPEALQNPSIQKLLALHDNYEPSTSIRESYTQEEEAEMDEFINLIFSTPVMQAAQAFLESKNLPSGKESFFELWFELYTRGNGIISSSGFEHVFMGELNSNGVSGFHNWEYFSIEENAARTNYFGYMDYVNFGSKGSVIEHSFTWQTRRKPVSSMFIGTSPELELALYTVCFHSRPNAKCPVKLNEQKIKIQTYTIGSRGQNVGTAYPDLSDNEKNELAKH